MSIAKCTASKCSSSARDREVFRYYLPPTVPAPDVCSLEPGDQTIIQTTKKASSDPTLTAFAQLGCLRIDCKRGIIVLSTRRTEYILAEATRELSLQQDNDESDQLWHGEGAILNPESEGLGGELRRIFEAPGAPAIMLCADMTKDDRFKDFTVVTGPPYIKAIACVPLISPLHNMVVGQYIVVDDKVHGELDEGEQQFMLDMATTVMDYLESGRIKRQQYRAERMIKAIGLFIEGKATLREWWLETGHKYQHAALRKRSIQDGTPLDQQADIEFGVQETTDYFTRNGLNRLPDSTVRNSAALRYPSSVSVSTTDRVDRELGDGRPPIPRNDTNDSDRTPPSSAPTSVPRDPTPARRGDGRPQIPRENTASSSGDTSAVPPTSVSQSCRDRNSSVTTFDETLTDHTPDPERHTSVSFDLPADPVPPEVSKDLQNAVLSSDVKGVFARASNLIREAIGVEGVIYYDASVGSFGGRSRKEVVEDKAPGPFHADPLWGDQVATSEDDLARQSSGAEGEFKKPAAVEEKGTEKYCNILGFSTRRRSSLKGHDVYEERRRMPETVLRKLLKRYPHGKVFNFDEDGTYSSSDSDHCHPSTNVEEARGSPQTARHAPEASRRHRISREQEAAEILNVLPGARSVFWFPLWDATRERWFAGSFIWSTSDTRTLCPTEDVTYLAAFGNSTMAEISRLSAQVLSKMKTDFISSISHELRSPLHGVLASVEFLQETPMTETQADMVSNIHSSGKVLLDTINHVLDFSKVNRKTKNKKMPKRRVKPVERQGSAEDGGEEKADVCILSEEVIESIYAGQGVSKKALGLAGHRRHGSAASTEPAVTVIVDIQWRPNWTFEVDAGAWRRILMNLFSNAMKYTKAGFVNICLEVEEDVASHRKKSRANLVLKLKDSGKGISQEFLNHQLYKPFTQEDSLATGAGLGLSIVKAIIQDLGGKIAFTSEPGTGTEVTVRIPLQERSPKPGSLKVLNEVRASVQGHKFRLEGFDRYPDIAETPTGILSPDTEGAMLLKSAVQGTLVDWYGMEAVTSSGVDSPVADLVVVMEAGIGVQSLDQVLNSHYDHHPKHDGRSVAIVLTSSYHSEPRIDAHQNFRVFYLQQPYGPHRIGKILHQAFCETSDDRLLESSISSPPQTLTLRNHRDLSPRSPPPTSATLDFAGRSPLSLKENQSPAQEHPAVTPDTPLTPGFKAAQLQISDRMAANGEIPVKKGEGGGLRVLLVEDNEINLKLLIATMRKLKLDHATAVNGLEALNSYKECAGAFDVIFMDISMPIMSGIESTRQIRRFEQESGLQPVAVIALTGAANPRTRQEAFSVGVDLFLTKPVPMKALRGMLEDVKREGRAALVG
ncbi:hypothetical protein LZ554_004671 [Drepanopeziza brunnea f. sp. 'monogermtubi']|nr:hypothetical protein LZ554_004671 [Drepanopeziza brunnea f. sp. 'monogermtubi']